MTINSIQTANMNFTPPKIGVVDVPELSKTPLTDTLNLRKKELGPRPKFKTKKKNALIPSDFLMAGAFTISFSTVLAVLIKKLAKSTKIK